MKVFVAGSTGAIGRRLVPLLLERGHEVIALARAPEKARALEAVGARVALADALDRDALTAAIARAKPEAIVHELTAIAGGIDLRRLDDDFALTNRLRTEVTDTLLAAARRVGAHRVIVQGFCGWLFARDGGPVKTEDDPLDPEPPAAFRKTLAALRHVEEAVRGATDLQALALRYGVFYGPGTSISRDGSLVALVRGRRMPVVGSGAGVWSFVHVDDAARATAAALTRGAPGVYNVVDDEPAPVSAWLPALAAAVGAPPPRRLPAWLGRLVIGAGGVALMTRVRGGSNARAKLALEWRPRYATWRRGFVEGLG
jgi:nucleoside-diphosphate-sugar epimerase